MNESDCEELVNSVCDRLSDLISDEDIRSELTNDLKLINNSYKSIIQWKNRRIIHLNNDLSKLKQQKHTIRVEDKQQKHRNIVNINTVNTIQSPISDVLCVQSIAIDNKHMDCVNETNGTDIESVNDNTSEDNSNRFDVNCVELETKSGRHCRSLVWKYFKYDSDNKMTYCLVRNCNSKGMRGKLAGNLKRHLKIHPKEWHEFNTAVHRLQNNIDNNRKQVNKSLPEPLAANVERGYDLFDINQYFASNPSEDMATDIVFPNKESSIGRKCLSTVWKFFKYDSMANVSYCLVANCKSKGFRGKLAGNLRKHLLAHKRDFDELTGRSIQFSNTTFQYMSRQNSDEISFDFMKRFKNEINGNSIQYLP